MTSGSLGHTSARAETFFYNAYFLRIPPAPTAVGIGDSEDLNFGSVSMLGLPHAKADMDEYVWLAETILDIAPDLASRLYLKREINLAALKGLAS